MVVKKVRGLFTMKTHQERCSFPILVSDVSYLVYQITRKVIHKYVSADGTETQEVTVEGSCQEMVQIEEGDAVSRVIKRTVLRSEGDQKEVRQYCVKIVRPHYVSKFVLLFCSTSTSPVELVQADKSRLHASCD